MDLLITFETDLKKPLAKITDKMKTEVDERLGVLLGVVNGHESGVKTIENCHEPGAKEIDTML